MTTTMNTSEKNVGTNNEEDAALMFPCDLCGQVLSSRYFFMEHRRVHTGEKPYQCKVCGAKFALKKSFWMHVTGYTGAKLCQRMYAHRGPYLCVTCGRLFTTQYSLKRHQQTHTSENMYTCETCLKSLSSRDALKRHMKRTHKIEFPLSCSECGALFADQRTLNNHYLRMDLRP